MFASARRASKLLRTWRGALHGASAVTVASWCVTKTDRTWISTEEGCGGQAVRGKWGLDRPARSRCRRSDAVLVISDLDGTLVGDEGMLRIFNISWLSWQMPRGSILTYNTARDQPLFLGLVHEATWGTPSLLRPDVLILAEGTEIWHFHPGEVEPTIDDAWRAKLRATWDEDLVVTECAKYNQPSLVPDFNSDTELRKAILVSGDFEASAKVVASLRDVLGSAYSVVDAQCWVEGVRIISVLPAAAGKGHAAEHVRGALDFASDRTMWAGDTRGDSSMLLSKIRGVIVGNASSELRADAEVAIRDGRVYQAVQRNAGGVLEGMKYFDLG